MSAEKAVIDRIRKLRALASKNDSAHEAEAAAAQAARLCAEHRIAEAQLHVAEGEDPSGVVEEGLPPMPKFAHWRSYLLTVLCDLHGCAHHYEKDKTGYVPRVYGRAEDLEIVRETYTWLLLAVERGAAKACKGKSQKYAEGYRVGIVYGLRDAMQAAKSEAEKAAPSTALAVLDARGAEATRRLRKAVRAAAKAPKAPTALDDKGYARGKRRGRRLHDRMPRKRRGDLGAGEP